MESSANLYPWMLTLGSLAAITWLLLTGAEVGSARQAGANSPTTLEILDAGLAALMGGIVAARAGYVLMHASFFGPQPARALAFWEGGLAGWAAIPGAVAGLAIVSRLQSNEYWATADALALPGTLLAFSLWLGCLADGCAFGRPIPSGALSIQGYDTVGRLETRWPTQTMGAIATALSLVPLRLGRRWRHRSGAIASLALALQAALALGLSFTRADPTPHWNALRLDTLVWTGLLLVSVLSLFIRLKRE